MAALLKNKLLIPDHHPVDVLVFKTNVRHAFDIDSVKPVLEAIPSVRQWHIDMQDVDRVLRIESTEITPEDIILVLHHAGYQCEELPD